MAGPSHTDTVILAEARQIYNSALMDSIRAAHNTGQPVTVKIGDYTVQYEPIAFSGFTSFGINGFVIGKDAFASESELKKTLLHELYRLHHSELAKGGGVDKHVIRAETDAAFQFAERFYELI
jgi:hypothetical protein